MHKCLTIGLTVRPVKQNSTMVEHGQNNKIRVCYRKTYSCKHYLTNSFIIAFSTKNNTEICLHHFTDVKLKGRKKSFQML